MDFAFTMQRQSSVDAANSEANAAASFISALMSDTCVKHYRESYDRRGWLWDQEDPCSQIYQESLPVIQALVYIAILLTKEEKI